MPWRLRGAGITALAHTKMAPPIEVSTGPNEVSYARLQQEAYSANALLPDQFRQFRDVDDCPPAPARPAGGHRFFAISAEDARPLIAEAALRYTLAR